MESKKWYWWTYLQGKNRDIDVVNIFTGDKGTNWESSIDIYTLPGVK